nr:alanyl-tRNA editing protein [Deltaproteobacteria bacterium]
RARAELFARDTVLRTLATRFSCSPTDVPAAIDKLARDAEAVGSELTVLRGRLATSIAAAFPGTGPVVAAVPAEPELLRSVAAKLVAAGRDAILCAPEEAGTTVVLFRAAGSTLDCGGVWKALSTRIGGRGGGRADRAEGRLTTSIADWPALIAELSP